MSTPVRVLALLPALLFALPATASAETTCTYVPMTHNLQVMLPGDYDRAILSVEDPFIFVSNGTAWVQCDGGQPKVNTVGAIQIGGGGFGAAVQIDDVSHFSPGVGDEAGGNNEIEIYVDLGNRPGTRLLVADDDPAGVRLRFGTGGINPNAFESERLPDADIFVSGTLLGGLTASASSGADVISLEGGAGTGGPLFAPIVVFAGDGADRIVAGPGTDVLDAGPGGDVVESGDGDDLVIPGPGDDVLKAGRGTDTVNYLARGPVSSRPRARRPAGHARASEHRSTRRARAWSVRRPYATPRRRARASRASGGQGDDILDGRSGDDVLDGGEGDDAIDVRDGGPDTADCGTEIDTVVADAPGIDSTIKCERLLFPGMPPSDGGREQPSADTLPPAFLGRIRFRQGLLRYALSEAGTVRIAIRRGKGRIRRFEAPAVAGRNSTRLASRRLRPGRYRATLLATDAAGNRSEPRRTTFKVVRRGERVRSRRGPGRAGR